MKRTNWRNLTIILGILLVIAGLGAYKFYVSYDCVCGLEDRTPLTVWNPFYAREPRRLALQTMTALRDGKCTQLPATLFTTPDVQQAICDTHSHHLVHWNLRSVERTYGGASIGYGVSYDGPSGDGTPLWINLKKDNGAWKIDDKSAVY